MFPFLLADNLPDSLLFVGETKVKLTNFDPENIDDIDYDEFVDWMDEQRALFDDKEVNLEAKMLALEEESELFLKSRVLKPEETKDQNNDSLKLPEETEIEGPFYYHIAKLLATLEMATTRVVETEKTRYLSGTEKPFSV